MLLHTIGRRMNYLSLTFARRKMSSKTEEQNVLFSVKNGVGHITLNRPTALNALDLSMVDKIYPQLLEWEDKLKLVLVDSTGDKSFCAGGDIRSITSSSAKGSAQQAEFFAREYHLNHLIGNYKIPYVALINGITMGGGVGLSIHAPYIVATSNTVFAMPETGIGLVPDVGGSYFLPKLKGYLGTYLALTGQRLKGADTVLAGLATHACHHDKLEQLKTDILSISDKHELDSLLNWHTEDFMEEKNDVQFSLSDKLETIEECFGGDTIEEIEQRLRKVAVHGGPLSAWAQKTVDGMLKMSPTSMKVTLKQMRQGEGKSLKDCLAMEYRLVRRCCEDHDFYEGVRALLVERDNKPQWRPDSLDKVTVDMVDRYFSRLPEEEELKIPRETIHN